MNLTSTPAVAERITAFVSAVVAIGLLGLAGSAQTGRQVTADPIEQLTSETRLQFRLALGHDRTLLETRTARLDRVLQAYETSDQTNHDRNLLIDWLREAMARTMPGAVRPLLPMPDFDAEPLSPPTLPDERLDTADGDPGDGDLDLAAADPEEYLATMQEQMTPSQRPSGLPPQPALESPAEPLPHDDEAANQDILGPPPTTTATLFDSAPTPTLADPSPADRPETPGTLLADTLPRPAGDDRPTNEQIPGRPEEVGVSPIAAVVTTPPVNPPTTTVSTPGRASAPAETAGELPIAVNTNRLAVEIASYHATLGQVREVCQDKAVAFGDLREAVDTLERLTTQYDFIRLYHDLLTPGQQRQLGQPTDWADLLPDVQDALDRVPRQTDGDFLRPLESDRREALAELRQQVAKLAKQATR